MARMTMDTVYRDLENANIALEREKEYSKKLEGVIAENERNFIGMRERLISVENNVLEFKFKHVMDIHRAGMMRDEDMIEMAYRNASRALADSIMLKAICEKETNDWGQPVFTFTIRIPKE